MSQIFISYRRNDSAAMCDRIYESTKAYFGREAVFRDIDSIPLGVNFKSYLEGIIPRCTLVLVVIGKQWMDGNRTSDPNDFVRLEVEAALAHRVPIIPLFVDNAAPPRADQVAPSLAPMLSLNGTSIGYAPHFDDDMRRLNRRIAATFPTLYQIHAEHDRQSQPSSFVPPQPVFQTYTSQTMYQAPYTAYPTPAPRSPMTMKEWLILIALAGATSLFSLIVMLLFNRVSARPITIVTDIIIISTCFALAAIVRSAITRNAKRSWLLGLLTGAFLPIFWLIAQNAHLVPKESVQPQDVIAGNIQSFAIIGALVQWLGGLIGLLIDISIRKGKSIIDRLQHRDTA